MKTTVLADNIFYIENAFPEADRFIKEIEEHESNQETHSVIPPWENWYHSKTVNDLGEIINSSIKGQQKLFDWDITATNNNNVWPRPEINFNDVAHNLVKPTIDLIDKQYLKVLDIWCEKTESEKIEYVSKNYLLRKYYEGGETKLHIDRNMNRPLNTNDWTVLFYLNDDYEGGELYFDKYNIELKPSAGSAVIWPWTTSHGGKKVLRGEKYHIFMSIHSKFNHSTALTEPYYEMNKKILEYKNISDHPLLD
jgi:hypothetical protein